MISKKDLFYYETKKNGETFKPQKKDTFYIELMRVGPLENQNYLIPKFPFTKDY